MEVIDGHDNLLTTEEKRERKLKKRMDEKRK
jgi:hypothetical protein